jgi:hypothetical protein
MLEKAVKNFALEPKSAVLLRVVIVDDVSTLRDKVLYEPMLSCTLGFAVVFV